MKDAAGVPIIKSVHMECMPSSPLADAEWLEDVMSAQQSSCVAIVAACDLSADDVAEQLALLKAKCPHLVGIRYIVDYAGPWGEAPATHVAVSRHTPDGKVVPILQGKGVDFLRDPVIAPKFEFGFARLAEHGLRFDLQCAPEQLMAAAHLVGRHPNVPVVLDHLGKPRLGSGNKVVDAAELVTWRSGMKQLAAHDHVYVKLSMLGYAVPGWVADKEKEELLAALVLEVIDLFGPQRCMFSTNWWSDGKTKGAMANSDGRDEVGISFAELWQRYLSWVEGRYSAEDIQRLFSGSAEEFYGI